MRAVAKQRILVVDDEPQILVALEDLLGSEYIVLKGSTGQQAVELVEQHPDIAVVVSDQRMPEMTGDQLFSSMRGRSDASKVLVTGYADLGAVVKAVNEGRIFAYVNKPWDPERLRLTVDKAAEHFRLQQELRASEERLRLVVAGTGAGLFDWNVRTGVMHYSDQFAELLGEPAGSLEATFAPLLFRLHPGDVDTVTARLDNQRDDRAPPWSLECRLKTSTGTYRWFSMTALGVRESSGDRTRIVGAIRDITEQKEQQERLSKLSRVRALSSAVNASILREGDPKHLLTKACEVAIREGELAAALTLASHEGADPELVACNSADPVLASNLSARLTWSALRDNQAAMASLSAGRPYLLNDTSMTPELCCDWLAEQGCGALALFPLFHGGFHGVYVLAAKQPGYFDTNEVELIGELTSNIALALEHEAKSQRLSFVLSHDPLTGLGRRELFLDRLQQRLAAIKPSHPSLAVFWIDVSRFRQINEALGRAGGDEVLRQIAARLAHTLSDADGAARLDANAFGIISALMEDESDAAAFLEKITSAFRDPLTLEESELRIAVTIGVALYPVDGDTAEVLLSNCETAGKEAKAQGQPYLFYSGGMTERIKERLALENRLRTALDEEQFVLHYQPKVSVATGEVVGFEALIRWNDPSSGLVPPGSFIPVLEDTGLILQAGAWVLEEAARQYSEWSDQGASPPRISVNVSAIQLADAAFVPSIDRVVAKYPKAAKGLDLEITESVLMTNLSSNMEKLRFARDMGFEVAIDDFGTGYSSLGYLHCLPLDALKIDRSFVDCMDREAQDMNLVMTIISLAHSLGLTVIAEGVESDLQAKLLGLLRCDQLQGFLISKPVPGPLALTTLSRTDAIRRSRQTQA